MSAEEPGPGVPTSDDRFEIMVGHDDAAVLDAAEAALVARDLARPIYVSAGRLVRVLRAGEHRDRRVRELVTDEDAPVIDAAPVPWIRERLSTVAAWKRWKRTDAGLKLVACDVPEKYAQQLAARGEWRYFPRLDGVTEAPTLRADGTILDVPGYDAASRLLYAPRGEFPAIPAEPTLADAVAARDVLLDVLAGFPFVKPSDRAAAIGAILTIAGRFAFRGPAPMFFFLAPARGTGKTLLARVCAFVVLGREPSVRFATRDASESRKAIFALALAGARVVLVDNVVGDFGDETWAATLTTTEIEDRVLGVSEIRRVSIAGMTFLGTGNNVRFVKDCGRRVAPVRLDARVEVPEERTGFTYPDLIAHVATERPRLLTAALTILRAFHVAERPAHGAGPRIGSYEAWDDLIRGACVWVGAGDPAGGRAAIREDSDGDLEALRGAVGAWAVAFSSAPRTAAEAIHTATLTPEEREALATPEKANAAVLARAQLASNLRSALAALADVPTDQLTVQALGVALRSVVGRPVDGARFAKQGRTHGLARWVLRDVSLGCDGEDGGDSPHPTADEVGL